MIVIPFFSGTILMMLLKGTIENGQVVLPAPADLPDGTPVTVLPLESGQTLGIPDDQWPIAPDEIAHLMARMDRVEPFDMTPAEETETAAWQQQVKEYSLAKQAQRLAGLFE